MNEDQVFYVDDFYNEIIQKIRTHSYSKQEKFKIVYQAINKLMNMSSEIRDTQALTNGIVYLLAFMNNRPVDGFTVGRPMLGKYKKEYKTILKHEFNSRGL